MSIIDTSHFYQNKLESAELVSKSITILVNA